MKACKAVSNVAAVAGLLLMVVAVVGRFVFARTVFGGVLPGGGMAASSVMLGANTLLALAILARLWNKE